MINGIKSNLAANQNYSTKVKQNDKKAEAEQTAKAEKRDTVEIGLTYNKSVTYTNSAEKKLGTEEIDKLWEQTEKAQEVLKNIVEKLITRQGLKAEDIYSGKEKLVIDEQAVAEAQMAISEDGEWGVEAVSTRIIEFAKAISGGDKSKISELKEAVKKGFQEAANYMGELPDICKETYDEVMEKFDAWESEENRSEE